MRHLPRLLGPLALLSSLSFACGGAVDLPPGPSEPSPTSPTTPTTPAPSAPALVGSEPAKVTEPATSAPGGVPFHLVLSNQSFDTPLVDVRAFIDGVEVVRGDFHVKGQHSYYTFDFKLAPGAHTVQVSSSTGLATTSRDVVLTQGQERWGLSFYWTDGCKGGGACSRSFSFDVMNEQPLFD